MNKQGRELQARIGHLLDLYRIAKFNFSYPHSYTKFKHIKALAKQTGATTFIETGTYLGVTTRRCAPHFKKVYTIELDDELAQKAKLFLAKYPHIEVIKGDAVKEIKNLFESQSIENALIFLDGHFSGGDTACGDLPEPAIEELETIATHQAKVNAVIIDDFRLFGVQEGFPKKSALLNYIEEKLSSFNVRIHLDQVVLEKKA